MAPDGQYKCFEVPFRLASASAVFRRAINGALGNMRDSVALVCLGGVLIPSENLEEAFGSGFDGTATVGFSLNLERVSFFLKWTELFGNRSVF